MTDLISTASLCGCGVKESECAHVFMSGREEWVSGEMGVGYRAGCLGLAGYPRKLNFLSLVSFRLPLAKF